MLKVRVLTGALLGALILAAIFLLPTRFTMLFYTASCMLAAWEWAGFGALRGPLARAAYALAIAAILIAAQRISADGQYLQGILALACLWWVAAFLWLSLAPQRQGSIITLLCGVIVLVPAFVALAHLQASGRGGIGGAELVMWLVLLVSGADIGAFFAGSRYGRHKLAPRVSPGKSWEGVVGGLAAVALVSALGAWRLAMPAGICVALGCVVGIFSVVGDLTESMFKRAAGLKDSGRILPGHGGILDRLDSVVAAAPIYALCLVGSGAIL